MMGYLNGVAIQIMVVYICLKYPGAAAPTIVKLFFDTYAKWEWPNAIYICNIMENKLGQKSWNALTSIEDRNQLMPEITPAYPHQNTLINVSKSNRSTIVDELKKVAAALDTNEMGDVFAAIVKEEEPFVTKFQNYVLVLAAGNQQFQKLVEVRLRNLSIQLERLDQISLARLYPQKYKEASGKMVAGWLIGLEGYFEEDKFEEAVQNSKAIFGDWW